MPGSLRVRLLLHVTLCGVELLGGGLLHAQPSPTIPRARHLALVQTLHLGDTLDRESVVTLIEASPAGITYQWSHLEVRPTGDTTRGVEERFVRSADLDTS